MKQAKVLDHADEKRCLGVISQGTFSVRNRAIFMTSLLAGLRACEIAGLKVGSVVGPDGNILGRVFLEADGTKGNEGRAVYISEKLKKELRRYVDTLPDPARDEPLFRSRKRGAAFGAHGIVNLLGRIYTEAGCPGATSHSGRRTFITRLANKGVAARTLQGLAGHKSLTTTQRYIDLNEDLMSAAVELL